MNLLGVSRGRAAAIDLGRVLDPDRHAALSWRLREVRAWWPRLDGDRPVAHRARTPALRPDLEEEPSLPAVDAALLALAERRSALLGAGESGAGPAPAGRLVVCALDLSIGGGEAEAASRSLFDVDDRPPWDLWLVAWGDTAPTRPDEPTTCVLAWIPEQWSALAQAGIDACPTGALRWLD